MQRFSLQHHELAKRFNFFDGIYPQYPQIALLMIVLIVVGCVLASATASVRCAWDDSWDGLNAGKDARFPERETAGNGPPVQRPWINAAVLALYAGQIGLWLSLWNRRYSPVFLPLWAAGLAAFALAWRVPDRRVGARWEWPFSRREALGLLTLCGVFTVYASSLSTSWRYAWAPDEMPFFDFGKRLAAGEAMNAFSPHGPFGYHPVLGSLWVAWFMRIFGPAAFAWRLSSVVAVAVAIPGLYLFVREIVGRRAAALVAILFAANHYVITFALKGFNNGHVFAPTFWALALWCLGVRWRSQAVFYLAGVATGFGFYTYYTARLTLGFSGLAFLCVLPWSSWRQTIRWAAAYVFGLLVTVVPLVVSGTDFIGYMLRETAMYDPSAPTEGWLSLFWGATFGPAAWRKWQWVLLEPFYSTRTERFVYGSQLDSFTSSFALVGVTWAVVRGWRSRLLPWLVACTAAVGLIAGVLAKYDLPPFTRMILVVPFYLIFTSVALHVVAASTSATRLGRLGAGVLTLGVLLASITINQHRLLVVAPRQIAVDPHGLLVELAQTSPPDVHFYYVVPAGYGAETQFMLAELYGYTDRAHLLPAADLRAHRESLTFPATFVFDRSYEQGLDELVDLLRARYPHHGVRVLGGDPDHSDVVAVDVVP